MRIAVNLYLSKTLFHYMYAIVDIETTGSYSAANCITEIAICIHDGHKAVDWFQSLVKPDRPIPSYITALTGISNQMVANAPTFEELMPRIEELTYGKIFVAHHVHFDYSFIKNEFERLGSSFVRKKLCTVRLSRKLLPGMPSYSLNKLCNQLSIEHTDVHRAMGDVKATVTLFEKLLKLDHTKIIDDTIKRGSGETILPAHLPKEQFENLPETPGVYYFKDKKGKIIYIGKAANIKQRVRSHFTGADHSAKSISFKRQIHDVTFRNTGNELIALLLEDSEIRKFWPRFNQAQKTPPKSYGVYLYEDMSGFYRLGINRVPAANGAWQTYAQITDAKNAVSQVVVDFNLCPRLSGLGSFCDRCSSGDIECCTSTGTDSYNKRVLEAVKSLKSGAKSYAIVGQGRDAAEKSVVLIDQDHYIGFGFVKGELNTRSIAEIKPLIQPYSESVTIRNILRAQLSHNTEQQVHYLA